jgi:hypothetical protein
MDNARLMRLLSRLAAGDLAVAERRAAEAAANLRSMARNVTVLDGYTRDLSAALAGGGQSGYDFAVTIGFRTSGIKAAADAAAAAERGQGMRQAALARLARELERRDAIAAMADAIDVQAEREYARIEDRR